MKVQRTKMVEEVHTLVGQFPIVAIVGPRQVGKTTLARQIGTAFDNVHTFDLEDPADLARLADPGLALRSLSGLVIIDEIQRMPELFPLLRVLADRDGTPARFLILGSAAPQLIRGSSESLAGRIAYVRLTGFTMEEVGVEQVDTLWLRGGFPKAFLAETDMASVRWRKEFISTFLQRDLPQLGFGVSEQLMRRFWTMLAHYHGQTLNSSELGRSIGVSDTTIRQYIDILEQTYVVRTLPPWHENISKRQVKSPKIFIQDSGLLHTLLGIDTRVDLERNPKLGASWEGFALAQVIQKFEMGQDAYFWATHAGAELDLLWLRGTKRRGFEFKRTEAPRTTKSMHSAIETLGLERLDVVHAGAKSYPLTETIFALSIRDLV